jgi:RNA polymerase primary sigma factor
MYNYPIEKKKLLSREEEIELAAIIKKGGEKGDEAKKKLAAHNIGLVVKIAQDYGGMGIDVEDLINEGCIGLIKAAKKFDPAKGAKFSYYSSFWIKQSIRRSLSNKARLIRMPVATLDKYFKMRNFISAHKLEFGRDPSYEEIAEKFKLSKPRVAEIIAASEAIISLDSDMTEDKDNGSKFSEVIEDRGAVNPLDNLLSAENLKVVEGLISGLSTREQFIIQRRFGLNGLDKQTLEKIGNQLEITRERVRQIESAALIKLKALAKSKFSIEKYIL